MPVEREISYSKLTLSLEAIRPGIPGRARFETNWGLDEVLCQDYVVTLPKPLMIFDGDCRFCRRWIGRWRELTGESVEYEPYQSASERFPEIPPEVFARAVQFVEPGGRRSQGA